MRTRKLITRCVVMIAACLLAYSARAQTTCPNMNLWVNGTFEGNNFQCNIYNPAVNFLTGSGYPWNGYSYFVCQPGSTLPVQPLYLNEATIDHTLGTGQGHYLYLDPRNGTGNVMQISQVINIPPGGGTFRAWFCSMIYPGNNGATVRLAIDGTPISSALTLNSTVLNNWIPLTVATGLTGVHTLSIIVQNPFANNGYDFAIDDISFTANMKVDAGPDATVCATMPVTLGGNPTAIGASCTGNGYTYNWTPAVGLSSTTVANPVLTQSTPGVYTYTVTVTDMNGQTCSDQIQVTVNPCNLTGTFCQNMNLWVNGDFEGNNFSCNIYNNAVNALPGSGSPWNGVSYFVCQPSTTLPVQVTWVNEAMIDHTFGTGQGHYLYLDPRNGSGNVMQVSQVVNIPPNGGYFSAAFCSMLKQPYGNIGATVRLWVGGQNVATTTLNSFVLNDWQVIGGWTTQTGTQTLKITVDNPQAVNGYDFAIDDISFMASMQVDAGEDQSVCSSVPVTLGGNPTAKYGATCMGNGYTYDWTPAMGLSSTSVANPVLTQSVPGTYFYTVTVTDMNGQTCSDQVMVEIKNCPSVCPADNLWVNGEFENLNVNGQCNIYNSINVGPPWLPYNNLTTFIYEDDGPILDPNILQPNPDHTPGPGTGPCPGPNPCPGHYFYVDPAQNTGATSQIEQQIKIMPSAQPYIFRAWVYNMTKFNPAILPTKVELLVNGNSIPGSGIVSLGFGVGGWTLIQGFYTYAGPNPTTVTASIVIHNPVVIGCDIAIDDIYFGSGIITADAGPNAWVCPNVPHTLGGSPTADFGATCNGDYTYSWTPTTGFTTASNIANPIIQISSGPQTYHVVVTDLNGYVCQDDVTINVFPACKTKGSGEESPEEPTPLVQYNDEIKVYPVPAKDVVHITAGHDRPLQVTVYNTMGQKVIEKKMSSKLDLNVANWAREVYYIHLVDEENGQRIVKSIVIQ